MILRFFDTTGDDGFASFDIKADAHMQVRRDSADEDEPIRVQFCGREFGTSRRVTANLSHDEAQALLDGLREFFANEEQAAGKAVTQ